MNIQSRSIIIILMMITANPVYAFTLKCTAQHRLIHDDTIIKAAYQFFLNKNSGVIKIDGTFKDSESTYHISREIKITYTENHGVLLLENKGVLHYPLEDIPADKLKKHYPPFFIDNGMKLSMIVESLGKKSYSLTYNTQPLFFCSNLK